MEDYNIHYPPITTSDLSNDENTTEEKREVEDTISLAKIIVYRDDSNYSLNDNENKTNENPAEEQNDQLNSNESPKIVVHSIVHRDHNEKEHHTPNSSNQTNENGTENDSTLEPDNSVSKELQVTAFRKTLADQSQKQPDDRFNESTFEDSSSKSHSFAYDFSKETPLSGCSDGYFNNSLNKLYERYMGKGKVSSKSSSNEEPTGCFDKTAESVNTKTAFSRCNRKQVIIISTTVISMLVAATAATILTLNVFRRSGDHYHGQTHSEENAEIYQSAAVVTSSSVCTKIGADILRKNGSAVDAAIASCFCLCVTSKHATSIGGGGFMLVYRKHNKTFDALDFTSTAPGKAKRNTFGDNSNATTSIGKFIGVPGLVKGLYTAWNQYGILPWSELVQPAINLTGDGFFVQDRTHEIAEIMKLQIEEDQGLRKLLLSANREPWTPGHLLVDPALSKTFTIISEKPEDFYSGELAVNIVTDVNKVGSLLSLDDMANYKVRHRDVIGGTIDGLRLATIGPPSGGPTVVDILNILKGYHFKSEDIDENDGKRTSQTLHRIIEAMKFAFAHRTQLGDPDFNDKDQMEKVILNMTDEDMGEKNRQKIGDFTHDFMYYAPRFSVPLDEGASHVSIVAPNGDAVSMTTTINSWFGGMYRSLDTGIIYNNQLKAFSTAPDQYTNLPPSLINSIHGGKRPLSSMAPVIVTNNKGGVKLVLGGSGGVNIIPAVAQVIMNKIWFDDNLGEAVYRPRVFHTLVPTNVTVEDTSLDPHIIELLEERNHNITENSDLEHSAVQAIYVDNDRDIHAKSDFRKYGHSDGF